MEMINNTIMVNELNFIEKVDGFEKKVEADQPYQYKDCS